MATVLGVGAGVSLYLATKSVLVGGVFAGIAVLIDIGVASAADSIRRGGNR